MTKSKKNIVIVIVAAVVIAAGIFVYNEYMSGSRYDIQDYIYDIQFSGNNGEGYVLRPRINYSAMDKLGFERAYNLSDVMDTVSYSADQYENLSNGDKVTITADYDRNFASARGIKLKNLTWTVEVQGLEDAEDNYQDYFGEDREYEDAEDTDDEDYYSDYSEDDEYGYVVGDTYTVQAVLRVREEPDIDARQLKRSELSEVDYANSAKYPDALLQKGSHVTCLEMSDNWMRIDSGWICVNDGEEVLVE